MPLDLDEYDNRRHWAETLATISEPVLARLAADELRVAMPVECRPGFEEERRAVTHLEAFGRVLAGISPWLELGIDESDEGRVRRHFIELSRTCLSVATNPASSDFMNFTAGRQPLVDTAFLAHGLLRAFRTVWEPLDARTKQHVVEALRSTRSIKPVYSNWLLFSAMIEAFLLRAGESWDPMRLDLAVKKHFEWYEGDGTYGDGPEFRWDYYNSFVIQPMLLDILKVAVAHGGADDALYRRTLMRARRYGTIQERLIAPDGTFPPIGRSLAYRFGAFQLLAQLALMDELPEDLTPGQVRAALSAVIGKMVSAPGTFDGNGWLTIGFYGHQPEIGEPYISTGSLYLCTTAFLPLGLPADHSFWTAPATDWTQRRAWSGRAVAADHALEET